MSDRNNKSRFPDVRQRRDEFLGGRHPGDISNPRQAEERLQKEQQAKRRDQLLEVALKQVGNSKEGRRVLTWILNDVCRVNESPKGGFESGMLAVGQAVIRQIKTADPEIYFTMIREEQQDGR